MQAVSHLLFENKGKAGKILAMHWLWPRIQGLVGYTMHLHLGSHAYVVYWSMKVKGIQDSIANEKHVSYKIPNKQDDKEQILKLYLYKSVGINLINFICKL